jgi:hypothetical protein
MNPSPARDAILPLAEGLLYGSEGDRPFEWFELPDGGEGWPYPPEEFARRMRLTLGTRVEETTLDRFLAHHVERTDPYDARAQALRPRYEALKRALRDGLRDARVFRAGRVEIDCYLVGEDGRGNLAGLHTVAIET